MPFPLSLLAVLIGLSCSHLNATTMWNIVALSEGMMVHAGGLALETYYQMLDPENRTESSLASTKTTCFQHYRVSEGTLVRCKLLDTLFDYACVRAAHIMQRRWLGRAGSSAYIALTVSPSHLLPPPLDPVLLARILKQQALIGLHLQDSWHHLYLLR